MARAQHKIGFGSIAVILGTAAVLAACTSSEPDSTSGRADLPYADEFPAVGYARNEPRGALGRLARRQALELASRAACLPASTSSSSGSTG